MTLLVCITARGSRISRHSLKGIVLNLLHSYFPGAPCYERFTALTKRVFVLLALFLISRRGQKPGIYYIDGTPLPVCHNLRITKPKVFAGLAARGKTTMGWFFGFKLHLVFNHRREIVALKLTSGQAHFWQCQRYGSRARVNKRPRRQIVRR
jgi:Transposase DDE domain